MYTHVHTYTHARVASKCLSHTVDARRSLLAHPACVCSPLPPVAVNHSLHLLPTDTLHNTPFCSLLAMVKFGTRLPTLMRPQWAAHYVQYDRLNAIVSTVSDGETPEIKRQRSDEFLRLLSEDIIGANTFFLQQLEAARATIGKLKGEKTNGWTLPSGMVGDESSSMTLDEVCKLENLSEGDSAILVSMNDLVADLRALRKYVATNVVAATSQQILILYLGT